MARIHGEGWQKVKVTSNIVYWNVNYITMLYSHIYIYIYVHLNTPINYLDIINITLNIHIEKENYHHI